MEGEAGWWITSWTNGLPPLARVMGVGRQQQQQTYIAIKQGTHRKSVTKFCATRWTARVDTLSALIAKYKLILETLEQIQDTSHGDAKRDADSYIRLLSDSKLLVIYVKQTRTSTCLRKLLPMHVMKQHVSKSGAIIIQRHRSNAVHDQRQSLIDYFLVNAYYQFIDHIVQELDTRFSDQHSGLISAETLVCINSIKGYYSKFLERKENFDVEVDKWTTFYNKFPVDSRPQDVCTALAACDPNYFHAINRILVIFCTTPVGSVACEGSFSALLRL